MKLPWKQLGSLLLILAIGSGLTGRDTGRTSMHGSVEATSERSASTQPSVASGVVTSALRQLVTRRAGETLRVLNAAVNPEWIPLAARLPLGLLDDVKTQNKNGGFGVLCRGMKRPTELRRGLWEPMTRPLLWPDSLVLQFPGL